MDSIIKELELNGWEVRTNLLTNGHIRIEKGRFVFMGTAKGVLWQAQNSRCLDDWIALEEESEQHCMIESTVKLLDKIYGTRDGTQS